MLILQEHAPAKITNEFLIGQQCLVGIFGQDREELLRVGIKP